MKKYIALLMLCFSTSLFASDTPIAILRVFDNSNQTPKVLSDSKISRSHSTQQLCWFVTNMPFNAENDVEQIFQSPKTASFILPKSKITVSKDKKTHTLITKEKYTQDIAGNYISQCWQFDKKDPIGTYKLTLKVNNIQFSPLEFIVTP